MSPSLSLRLLCDTTPRSHLRVADHFCCTRQGMCMSASSSPLFVLLSIGARCLFVCICQGVLCDGSMMSLPKPRDAYIISAYARYLRVNNPRSLSHHLDFLHLSVSVSRFLCVCARLACEMMSLPISRCIWCWSVPWFLDSRSVFLCLHLCARACICILCVPAHLKCACLRIFALGSSEKELKGQQSQ